MCPLSQATPGCSPEPAGPKAAGPGLLALVHWGKPSCLGLGTQVWPSQVGTGPDDSALQDEAQRAWGWSLPAGLGTEPGQPSLASAFTLQTAWPRAQWSHSYTGKQEAGPEPRPLWALASNPALVQVGFPSPPLHSGHPSGAATSVHAALCPSHLSGPPMPGEAQTLGLAATSSKIQV